MNDQALLAKEAHREHSRHEAKLWKVLWEVLCLSQENCSDFPRDLLSPV